MARIDLNSYLMSARGPKMELNYKANYELPLQSTKLINQLVNPGKNQTTTIRANAR